MRVLTTPVTFQMPFSLENMPRRVASIGSCFSEKIVELLSFGGFECASNPNGIVYNPASIAESVLHITENRPYDENDFFEYAGIFHSREHHGCFSSEDLEQLRKNTEQKRAEFREFLKSPCPVILTFGTAVVFREKKSGRIVANCHKVPGTEFSRELLSTEECFHLISRTAEELVGFGEHPVILAVSPVRHHPGDPVLNTRSKSILIEACHLAVEKAVEKYVYFPACELLHDELRDYRFYAEDLIHPSETAEEFILETFIKAGYKNESEQILTTAWNNRKRNRHVPGGIK